jgi:Protein of unknown function (DUF1257).
MSHLTTIKTSIRNPVILEQVLNKLIESQLDILTGATLETNSKIRNNVIADFVIRRPRHNYNLGFKLNSQGEYEFISDNDAWGKTKFLEALLPLYSRENTIYQLIAQGFEIESQIEADGIIKIVAGKWS